MFTACLLSYLRTLVQCPVRFHMSQASSSAASPAGTPGSAARSSGPAGRAHQRLFELQGLLRFEVYVAAGMEG